jgi:hypothetical protein
MWVQKKPDFQIKYTLLHSPVKLEINPMRFGVAIGEYENM